MSKELFGTDGIRGVPGEFPLDNPTLEAVGGALGAFLRSTSGGARPRVLLGMDTRESSAHLAARLARGAMDAGAEVASAGVISTPGVACLVRADKFSAGVVVSASHNPYTDNGIKLISPQGTKFSDEVEAALERDILERRKSAGATADAKLLVDTVLDAQYLDYLRHFVLPGARLEGMPVVLDCANGAVSELGPSLFHSLGARVTAIHNRPNGKNINDGCGSLHPESLRETVRKTGAELGAAFDGDADRAIFVSRSGRIVDGDGVLFIAARHMKAAGTLRGGVVVGTTMTNLGLERALQAEGIGLARAPVGDRYVLEEMQRLGANLGGEQSGHIIFLDDSITGDGLLTALIVSSLVSLHGPIDMLAANLKVYPQRIVNVRVKSKPPLETLEGVARTLAAADSTLGAAGRVVLRYSGTEPVARVMVEAEREEDVERWTRELSDAVRGAIGA
ncbi:MAG TPA: phosphoglucosamine mutase [Candidatus Acidoferrales bacterium]|nr:phosphoglucosamine mutase [Candidatus Acidoferrales bacterium]